MIFVGILQFTMEHPMIRTAIDTLSAKLSDGLSVSNSRLETLVCFLSDVFVEEAKLSGWSCNSTRKLGLGRSPLGFCEPQGS